MSELFNDIGKRLPYEENEDYLNKLIEEMTERAIQQQSRSKRFTRLAIMITSAAAVVLLIVGIGISVFNTSNKADYTVLSSEGPIDEFLNSLSDEEVAQLPYYEIEEIPEY